MGFFKDFKDDFSQAINELLPGEEYPDNDEIQVNTLGDELDVAEELSKLDGLLEQVEKRSGQSEQASERPRTETSKLEQTIAEKTQDLKALDDLENDDWEMPTLKKLDVNAFTSEKDEPEKQENVLEFRNRSRHSASETSAAKTGPRFVTPKTDLPELDDEWDDLDLFELPKTPSEKKVPDFLSKEKLTGKNSAFDAALDRELEKEQRQELKKESKKDLTKSSKKDVKDEEVQKTDAPAADAKQAESDKESSAERQLDQMKKELEKKELAKKEFERKEAEKKAFEKREHEKREQERKDREKREQQKRELEKLEQKLEQERLNRQMQDLEHQNKTAAKMELIDDDVKNERIREEQKMDAMMTGATTETTTASIVAEPTEKKVSMEVVDGDVTEEVSLITAGTKIRGNMETTGSFEIEGTIEGDIKCNGKLTVIGRVVGNSSASEFFADAAHVEGEVVSTGTVKVGLGSVIIGNIAATSAVIAGAVKGDIDVQGPVVVDTSAVIMGNIKSRSVQINNGAVIEGFCSQSYSDVDVESLFSNKNK